MLVTGADGFIGSHLAERLVREGATVRAFVYYNAFDSWGWLDRSPREIRQAIRVTPGDVRDPGMVRRAVEGSDIVFHLAALIGIPYSYVAPQSYLDTNVTGTLNVLDAVRCCAAGRLVHTSTSEVYGTAGYLPIDEEHPLRAQSPYAATKIAADQLALSYHRSFGVPVSVIRPFNTYGPRQSIRAVIPTIIVQLLDAEERVTLGNLAPTRDFNYVDDVVDGFLAVGTSDAALGEVINIGSSFEISIGRTAELIAELLQRPLQIAFADDRGRPPGSEVDRLCASHEKARRLLGWAPAYRGEDGLLKGLARTVEWFARPENRERYRERPFAL